MKPLTIQIVCPARAGTQHGNRVTALRWCRMLRELGHRPVVVDAWTERACDVLLALHASKSAPSIAGFRQAYPEGRLIVALTGTDLYRDFESNAAQRSIRMADQLVVLQPEALRKLSRSSRRKTAVVFQSVQPVRVVRPATPRRLRVVVAGHLRALKDPLRPALAARQLPSRSRIVIQHFGGVLEPHWKSRAEAEMKRNARYLWFGERTRYQVRRAMARAWMFVHPSKMEGGANVISEAIGNQVPVLASNIPGSVGLLGKDYAGYFAAGSTRELVELLQRCEADSRFYLRLAAQVAQRAPLFAPALERQAWQKLLQG